ncbi:hypothetical protein CPLU01_14003 [Colletotrichum plurivorum]|uniref:Uncharacterized protein n=1 Tax=Colletotrichum plurivorum TaxID=2175906 RepID=A0A8H6JMJ6_9PEZI|nr:hypothetical protein CPLU01_14003 [Colletotrichum plurivorum]
MSTRRRRTPYDDVEMRDVASAAYGNVVQRLRSIAFAFFPNMEIKENAPEQWLAGVGDVMYITLIQDANDFYRAHAAYILRGLKDAMSRLV